jgi:hypothetical protein
MKSSLKAVLGIALSVVCLAVQGQNFGQDNFVEVAFQNCNGIFLVDTSEAQPPATWHRTVGNLAGLVADPGQDGWSNGDPKYCGDYLAPGSPVDGFVLDYNGSSLSNSGNAAGFSSTCDLVGNNVYLNYGTSYGVNVWGASNDDLDMQVSSIIPRGHGFILQHIIITNRSGTDLRDIYYTRNMDPDNDQSMGGSFLTNNTVVLNNPADGIAHLTADGTSTPCSIQLYAEDSRARVSYGGFFPPLSAQDAYDGGPVYQQSGSLTADQAIQISFAIDDLADGESACFSYAIMFSDRELPLVGDLLGQLCGTVPSYSANELRTGAWQDFENTLAKANGLVLYPNPSQGLVYIEGPFTSGDMYRIFDLNGQVVAQGIVSTEQVFSLSVDDLSTGMYLVELSSAEDRWVERLVIE